MSLLEVEDIDAYYDESHILRSLSLEVEQGEVCALLGRNGAGKTTTLRSVAGARPPDVRAGTVRFRGDTVSEMPAEDVAMSGIGLVPEERRVFPNLTVEENLHLSQVARNRSNTVGRSVRASGDVRPLSEIYEAFPRLDERQNQMAGTLSGGEQQMLAIARALRQNPDLLMLDEPYEGLAPQIIEDVEDAVERINEAGTTVLLVEQNAAAAMSIADRCYIIDQGRIVFDGDSETLRDDDETRQRYLGV
ncbi:ABC transporter ATP-binding protein [Halosegnis marinus]|uniref:ABC transporter ATP-binding protein n=1 Tax=Halosegnis marinus TaxID=3034023 RepID=A0ABD5ZRP8_9EURY|nr:ABC transporter ATP-binding protein [Halosegnis sp. DT85]